MIRLHFDLGGAVQGVGFRPFVHRLARELGLSGWVRNSDAGVQIEVEGGTEIVAQFLDRLERERPPHAAISTLKQRELPLENSEAFEILTSAAGTDDAPPSEILPDLATCDDCLREILDPSNRRHGYPFTNCTHCGPRFSMVLGLPYDRANTTMRDFVMCDACRHEYESPENRRFHAQPNACPDCGPHLSCLDDSGLVLSSRDDALDQAARAIEGGKIVAVKGIGGFHLFCDARNPDAIEALRQRKHRPAKPFGLMMPTLDLARGSVKLSDLEADWLSSAAAPIVILNRRADSRLPESLAPGNPTLGIMLPYSPLHHLLMRRLGFPVVATSGNRGDEPICIDNDEAVTRLRGIADGFLVHDRPIARAVDDSVLRMMAGERTCLRRSRGIAPAPIPSPGHRQPVLAYGGDLKGTIAIANRDQVRLSQHFGDLASMESRRAYEGHLVDFPALCRAKPTAIACDRHPAYHSRQIAETSSLPSIPIQHHHAHAVACATENGIDPDDEFLAVVWDGTGYGDDGTIWGGEFLRCRGAEFERFTWLRPFPLPGGEKAVNDPRFAALGCLHEAGIPVEETPLVTLLTAEERRIAETLIKRGIQSPRTSSAGRLFDAVSALCGLAIRNEFEGQAAMALEFAASTDDVPRAYFIDQIAITEGQPIDWTPLLRLVVTDLSTPTLDVPATSRRFHMALAELIAKTAKSVACPMVALTGGCFQNRLLLESSVDRIRSAGLHPIWHRQVPPNDGGLALGQAVIASRLLSSQTD